MNYILSPEFHRQLWLRCTPLRLVAAPVVLGLLAYVAANLGASSARTSESVEQSELAAVATAMTIVYFFVVLVWGTLEAATSMATEMRTNTWDFQCMSSISPARLSFGKLFGATSYTWYVGLQALAIFSYAYAHYRGEPWRKSPVLDDTFYVAGGLLLCGLLGHAAAFLNYLVDLSSTQGRTTRALLPGGMGAFLIGLFVAGVAFANVEGSANHFQTYAPRTGSLIGWYGATYSLPGFLFASLSFFVGWFLIGGWRLTRIELMYRNWPFVWILFVVSAIAWDSGLLFPPRAAWQDVQRDFHAAFARSEPVSPAQAAFYAFLQVAAVTYAAMLNESTDFRKYARLAFFAKAGDLRRTLENMPKWCATLPVAVAGYILVLASGPGADAEETIRLTTTMSALSLFLIRDGIVIHGIHRLYQGRGGRFAILLYFVMVYALLPAAELSAAGADLVHTLEKLLDPVQGGSIRQATAFFFPIVMDQPAFSILPPFAEALAAAVGLHFILQRKRAAEIIANTKA